MSVQAADNAFMAGKLAAEVSAGIDSCPHEEGTFSRFWWTRGFAYQSRLFRAQAAEAQLTRLKELCQRLERGCRCEYDYRCGTCQTIIDLKEAVK